MDPVRPRRKGARSVMETQINARWTVLTEGLFACLPTPSFVAPRSARKPACWACCAAGNALVIGYEFQFCRCCSAAADVS